jgi:recombination protein RecA
VAQKKWRQKGQRMDNVETTTQSEAVEPSIPTTQEPEVTPKKKGKKSEKEKEVFSGPATLEQISIFNDELLKVAAGKVTFGENFKDASLKHVSTGSIKLDLALKVPFIEGSVVEYYGENQVGKTTFALEAAANAIAMGKPVYFFDLERKLREAQLNMIKRLDKKLFTLIRPDTGEEAVDLIHKCVTSVPGCFVIFDSLSALLPEVEDAEDASKQTMGLVARLCWKLVRKVIGPTERNKCIILFISHITSNLNPYASGDTTKGGKAIPDLAAQRIRLSRRLSEVTKDKQGNVVGQIVNCKIIKNNVNRPFIEVEVPIIYGHGIDRVGDLLGAAIDYGIVEKSGGWLKYDNKNLREDQLRDMIENDKVVRDDIRKKIKDIFED